MHAGTSNTERSEIAKQFNDANSSLEILICMYDVSALGLNLQRACSDVAVMTAARSTATEVQGTPKLPLGGNVRPANFYRLGEGSYEMRPASRNASTSEDHWKQP